LDEDERAILNSTDKQRLDGYTSFVCCSLQYPNPYYFSKARSNESLFLDWVILLLSIDLLENPNTLFCPFNAAIGRGAHVTSGESGFNSLFDRTVVSPLRTLTRSPSHMKSCPTDLQAEILVPDLVPLQDVKAAVVSSEVQARTEVARLRQAQLDPSALEWYICSELFDRDSLRNAIHSGVKPAERRFEP